MREVLRPATRRYLAEIAKEKAALPFHGFTQSAPSNLGPIIGHFPKWNIVDADGRWCAAFVYFCCVEAGFVLPYSPDECVSCSLAGCGGWEEFARGDKRVEYHTERAFEPDAGDIVLFDRVFCDAPHDHIGIVLQVFCDRLLTAEGNTGGSNASAVVTRKRDGHIRGYIRLPNGFRY